MISASLNALHLPALMPREDMLRILQAEEYGFLPPPPDAIAFEADAPHISHFCGGKATCQRVTAHCTLGNRAFSFPFYASLPTSSNPHPFFVHINFRPDIPDRYMPVEELIDNGFAVLSFDYNDVTRDNGDFTDGLAGVLFENGTRQAHDAGKIALWAWAAQRVMDYAETRTDVLDTRCSIVCGHSRLGKTAMLAAATDARFAICYSNDSGCSGAALARGNTGETIEKICTRFPYWFCEQYQTYRGREQEMPFDQHFLAACIAPRKLLIGSASADAWACPVNEFLCCAAASPAFAHGFVCEDRLPEVGAFYPEGDIGYHQRAGEHFFTRTDWHRLIAFAAQHGLK